MNFIRTILRIMLWVLCCFLAACNYNTSEDSGGYVKVTQTGAARTVQVQLTATKVARSTATAKVITASPSIPPQASPQATATDKPSIDQALLIEQAPDNGSEISKNFDFNVVWTLKNTGNTTWNQDYYIAFWGGDRIGDGLPTTYFLKNEVKPGETIAVIAHMKSPIQTGNYHGIWFFMNDQKHSFFDLNTSFYVQ